MSKFDLHFLQKAKLTAQLSYCTRKKVGAVLVRDNRAIADGYNGTLPGHCNCCEVTLPDGSIVTSEFTLHAEQNILTYCARTGIPTQNTTLYTTLSPCKTCAKLLAASGITRVVYADTYKDTQGIDFLLKANIAVNHIPL